MKLQKLEIENLGEITSFSFDFQNDIAVFPQRNYGDLLLGLSRAVSNRLFYEVLEKEGINGDTRVHAQFTFLGDTWDAYSFFNPDYTEEKKGGVVIRNGQKLTEKYYKNGTEIALSNAEYGGLRLPLDENARFWFCNGKTIEGEITGRARSWITDLDFINYFKNRKNEEFASRWIKAFQPVLIDEDKGLSLDFDEDGAFIPVQVDGDGKRIYPHLSESDKTVFEYLVFVEVNRFEFAREEEMGFRCAKKPLFIFNFAEYLDEGVDVFKLLKRATDLGVQVFLFGYGEKLKKLS